MTIVEFVCGQCSKGDECKGQIYRKLGMEGESGGR